MDRTARIIGGLLAIAGAAYVLLSAYMLSTVAYMTETLGLVKSHGSEALKHVDLADWRSGATFNLQLYLGVGAVATICGAAIALRKRWAETTWMLASAGLLACYLYAGFSGDLWWHYGDLLAFACTSSFFLYINVRRRRNDSNG